MIFKKIVVTGLLATVSMVANASLTIMNNTTKDSTAIINDGMCSFNPLMGESGITRAGKPNTISDLVLWYACHSSPHNCKADVFMTANCTGPKVATVLFDTTTGVKSISMYSTDYSFTGSGFSFTMNELNGENNSIW